MKNNVQIAIPSYKRAKTVRDKTLTTLTRLNVNPSVVTIFVGDAEQEVEYREVLKNTPYKNIVVGVPGMGAIRNFIQNYYPEDTYILNLDDDLIEINRRLGEKTLGQIADLNEIVREGFEACEREGARLWGIYAASNPFFMKDRVAVGLYYVIGSMWGCINKHGDAYNVTLDDKEDFERCLDLLGEGGLLDRWNRTRATPRARACSQSRECTGESGRKIALSPNRAVAS